MLSKTIKTIIIEDHPVFRMGLSKILIQEKDLEVVGEAEDANSGFLMVKKLQPDVVIVDITLKNSNGLELIKDIARHFPKIKTLVLSMHDEKVYAQRALQAGARGYIMKDETAEVIVKAIREIVSGEIFVSNKVMKNIVSMVAKKEYELLPIDVLTDRELAIFELIGKGKTTREISEVLHISSKTVGTYKERIKEKLELENAAQLVYFATKWVENPGSVGKRLTQK